MDIPRGHAMLPLTEPDFLDFIYNYFKAEYSPIRSFWSTATAEPRQPPRWISMGHELAPLSFRPANAQAQKDLESLDFFTKKWTLDSGFVRGIVVRFAKYEVHERLEKKLYESCRLDLMVRKALKEKHLIDGLWPSPAPRNMPKELLQQGVQVRKWYGDMFAKYFRHLHAVDHFTLRPEVDQRIKSSSTLMLVPFVDHLVFGTVEPILPIVAVGAGFEKAKVRKARDTGVVAASFGEPDRFEVRFDAPAEAEETYTRSVVRTCQCLKCGTRRDVKVVISIDPSPGPVTHSNAERRTPASNSIAVTSRRQNSKAAQKYRPAYNMPGVNDPAPREPLPPQPEAEPPNASQDVRPPSPSQKKQCLRCTFLNHPDLTTCEMCQGELPATLVAKPPSPVQERAQPQPQSKLKHAPSASVPPRNTRKVELKEAERPAAPNRHSLSSSLFSIFPFSQQHQAEHHANLPSTQPSGTKNPSSTGGTEKPQSQQKATTEHEPSRSYPSKEDQLPTLPARRPSTPPNLIDRPPSPILSAHPEMTLMPLTPPATTSTRPAPIGLPQTLMDDFIPVSPPPFTREEEEEDAGWGEVSREEAQRRGGAGESEDEEEGGGDGYRRSTEGLVDLDAVAREEMGVWGEREDE
ncbi:hypothetical protein K458DRAFT_431482 [Lentithecium fluviatile CBS 122367]|uniref:RanBP2-type domain-containing protein n=1 Tax=Lentithecium fluviatile CBS 122367 TaxID=1168545 RepID=A0A6G1J352_9PLEO|nr:hypothetical protein K458DRAFT_431482 [Lentithecium fluviatile CBS 122367]